MKRDRDQMHVQVANKECSTFARLVTSGSMQRMPQQTLVSNRRLKQTQLHHGTATIEAVRKARCQFEYVCSQTFTDGTVLSLFLSTLSLSILSLLSIRPDCQHRSETTACSKRAIQIHDHDVVPYLGLRCKHHRTHCILSKQEYSTHIKIIKMSSLSQLPLHTAL